MRNLKIVQDSELNIDSRLPLTASTWDTKNDSLLFTLGPSASQETIELRRSFPENHDSRITESQLIAAWDAPSPVPDLVVDDVLDLHYFPENGTACLVLAGGDIVQVREEPLYDQAKIEIVGSVDGGIAAAAWSPDEELLTIATRSDTLLFMTIDFDNVASVTLNEEDSKLSKHVSVGWGKSETQFKGKRAKALRDPTIPEKVDEGVLSAFDQREVTISWRGDGSFVALNSIIGNVSRRMIRIFNREGGLESVTEPVDGLEGALSWRPAGNLISAVQRLDEEVNIISFERNGLRHGSFQLRLNSKNSEQWTSPISLAWNVVSSVLAVSFRDTMQLWTMGNYHYYLKQEIQCASGRRSDHALRVQWHPEDPLRMSIVAPRTTTFQTNGSRAAEDDIQPSPNRLRHLRLIFTVARGPVNSPEDFGTVAVIDGESLKITPLRQANVPPPMALYDMQVECVKDVAINSSSALIAALHEISFSIIRIEAEVPFAKPFVEKSVAISKLDTQITRQICFRGELDIFVLLDDLSTGATSIYDNSRAQTYIVPGTLSMSHLAPSLNYEFICLQNEHTVDELDFPTSTRDESSNEVVQRTSICRFPSAMNISKFEVLQHQNIVIAFALNTNGALYANGRQLLKNCTSFLITRSYVILTTANHLLKFVHMATVTDLELPPDEPEVDERCRSIERGAKLVTVMPTTFSLVLQMPRGNLETIFPRALVLESIRHNIESRKYRKAFLTCRSQRVDMNILHDHAPKQFLADVALVVNQLRTVEYIDLFLSQLRNEDVSLVMYRQTLSRHQRNDDISKPEEPQESVDLVGKTHTLSKVNDICDAFLGVLKDRLATNLQNVITAHVCKLPPDIEAGLQVIAGLRRQQVELAERATEHVCFLADVNRVYDSALGLYDLDMALLVAQQSQKDPREYLPYLQSLQNLPPLRKQFTIDHDLGRHVKALNHLRQMEDFDEVKAYTKEHELYREALNLYRYKPEALRALTKIYADFLSSQNEFKDAGITYESLKDYRSACNSYRAANLWEECLSSATLIPLPPDEVSSLAQSIADHLSSTRDFYACGIINRDYLSDIPTAVSNFCKAHRFASAIRLAGLHRRIELLGEVVDPGLAEASGVLTELLADCKAQMNAQVPRLRELRKAKAANPLAFLAGDDGANAGGDVPDDISLAPSANSTAGGASLFTRYTQRSGLTNTIASGASRKTSKNRRREERKRARGKKGSVYEEEYLVNSIGRLIDRVNETAVDVTSTVDGLLRRSMRERAKAVEEAMVEVVRVCETSVGEVFEATKLQGNAPEGQGEGNGDRPTGAEGVLWDSLEESKAVRVVPVVKAYERSTLWT